MCKLVLMTVAAAAALAPAAALGQDAWTGIIGSGRPRFQLGRRSARPAVARRPRAHLAARALCAAPFGRERPKHVRLRNDRLHRGHPLALWARRSARSGIALACRTFFRVLCPRLFF